MWINNVYCSVEAVTSGTMGVNLDIAGRTFHMTPTDARRLASKLTKAAAEVALALTGASVPASAAVEAVECAAMQDAGSVAWSLENE